MAPAWPQPLPQILVLGLGLVLMRAAAGEQAPGAAAPPAPFRLLWPILGGALSLALVLALLSGFLVWRRCRRREKFTTPIEETGGEGCPGVALIQ
uniref:Tumor necrosis factor receptor superfamily, member 12a n=1 Tax=Cricetulus griseus TaxID=10029 RepID=A0A8C2N4C8_CRIGR